MLPPSKIIIEGAWVAVGIVWFVGAFTTKRTARAQSPRSRLIHITLAFFAIIIGFTRIFQFDPFTRPFVPASLAFTYAGIVCTLAGVAFAIWARFYLGGNWSSSVTVKENHSLVKRGPYAIVRHPIYSGFLLALLGTAIAWREVRVLLATGFVFVMLYLKVRLEEKLMVEHFGAEYRDYSREVNALIPFLY